MYLSCVGDVLALLHFQLVIHLFPVVGYGEDAVGAFEGGFEGGFVIDVALGVLSIYTGQDMCQCCCTVTHSMPFSIKALALGLVVSLVMPRS